MSDNAELPAELGRLCEEFEQQWKARRNPPAEEFLIQAPPEFRERFLFELLLLEGIYRHDGGQSLPGEELLSRFPDDRIVVESVHDELAKQCGTQAFTPRTHRDSLAQTLSPQETALAAASDRAAGTSDSGRDFGDYQILEEIARGGMGVVYKARQRRLNRIVALKMILSGRLADEEQVRRFHAEAEAAANLEHPGIVPIFEIGEHQGQHFFSMGFIEGESLQQKLRHGPLPSREAAHLILQVAEAIAYAHDHGVLHRDLKPANILCTPSGAVVVTDFGLAKKIDSQAGLTATGEALGTPGYLPPEQATGNSRLISARSDVYALGATLYCLLTGRPPFQSSSVMNTLNDVIEKDLLPPRLLNSQVDRDLELICLKCLEKNPQQRYASARDFLEDIKRYLEGETISLSGFRFFDAFARTLTRSKYDIAFTTWSNILVWFAVIVMAAEAALFAVGYDGFLSPLEAVAIRGSQALAFVTVLWVYHQAWLRNHGAIERQMLAIWIGFLVACHLIVLSDIMLHPPHVPFSYFGCYPYFSIVSGFMFYVFGSSHWGVCFLIGTLFFLAGPLMVLFLPFSPLVFGLLWAISLGGLGWRLRMLQNKQ